MITTPEEVKTLEQKVSDARITLSSLEQDYIRIRGLKSSEEYSLQEARKARLELDNLINDLSVKKDNLLKETSDLEKSRDGLTNDLQTLSKEISDIQTEKNNLIEEIENIKLEQNNQAACLTEREKEVSKREEAVDMKEASANQKIEIIKNFKSTL